MNTARFLFCNGVVLHSADAPPVTTFLESLPGAYTTTRTHENGTTLLFWERHLKRLANSARILLNSNPELIFKQKEKTPSLFPPLTMPSSEKWESRIRSLVNDSMKLALPIALMERSNGEELAVTALVCGNLEKLREMKNVDGNEDGGVFRLLDVHLHIGSYVPPVFGIQENGAHLALVGYGRDVAAAKYSTWVRLRKPLDKLRPPSVTELLLSNDGDRILEGCITNFFVICRRDKSEDERKYMQSYDDNYSVEVQTAPVNDGVLPGIWNVLAVGSRQIIFTLPESKLMPSLLLNRVCLSKGIPVREVAPSWKKHGLWEEAFITNSLRVLQHVETIKVPHSWESLSTQSSKGISWMEKQFGGPGRLTKVIQKEIMERASTES